jgi:hypothetical protein
MSRGGLDVSRPRKSERRGRPCFTASRRLSSRSRIQFELFDTGEGLGRLLSGGAIYYARLQAPARYVIPIKIFRRPAIREADFVAAALRDSFVFDEPDHHFCFAFRPSSTRRRTASERVVSCLAAQSSIASMISLGARTVRRGSLPVAGRPRRFLGCTFIDFFMNYVVP